MHPMTGKMPVLPRGAPPALAGRKGNLPGCCVDQKLIDLFQKQGQELNIAASSLMERILWAAFGKPELSYFSQSLQKSQDESR